MSFLLLSTGSYLLLSNGGRLILRFEDKKLTISLTGEAN